MANSTCFLAATELRPFARRTGLSEFSGLVTALDSSCAADLYCMIPNYPGLNIEGLRPAGNVEYRAIDADLSEMS